MYRYITLYYLKYILYILIHYNNEILIIVEHRLLGKELILNTLKYKNISEY